MIVYNIVKVGLLGASPSPSDCVLSIRFYLALPCYELTLESVIAEEIPTNSPGELLLGSL